jgi:integrase
MASSWIVTRPTKDAGKRFRVEYRVGGRESATQYGGSFKTDREAKLRKRWIESEFAAQRVPDIHALGVERPRAATLGSAAETWRVSRVDVSAGTMQSYRVAINRLRQWLGAETPLDTIDAATVAQLVADLHADGLRKQTIRKSLSVLGMVFAHTGIHETENPARDKLTVKLPREERRHIEPPTAEHVGAVVHLLPTRYRLPPLVLDATGMRIGELEALTWGDVDEPRGRWRIATSKTGRPRWVTPPAVLYAAVLELCPRDDRVPERPVFQGFGADRFRTAITRGCTAAGVPMFSPHDLRHRRVSLLHLAGVPWARIGEAVGHDDLVTTARTYTHVLVDETELATRRYSAGEAVGAALRPPPEWRSG